MDELPPSAKRLLALARDADEPDEGARERVRAGVAAAVGIAGAAAATAATSPAPASAATAAKIGVGSSAAIKLVVAGTVTLALGTAALSLRPSSSEHDRTLPPVVARTPSAPNAPAVLEARPSLHHPPQPTPQPTPITTPVQDSASSERRERVATNAHRPRAAEEVRQPASALRAEMTLLQEASTALDRGDLTQARALLKTHRELHAAGQLGVERRGLEVLTRCLEGDAGAVAAARAYLRAEPNGVLAARIAAACKLEPSR